MLQCFNFHKNIVISAAHMRFAFAAPSVSKKIYEMLLLCTMIRQKPKLNMERIMCKFEV